MYYKKCPACNCKKSNFFFSSVNKDLSFKGFNYHKCQNCKSVFLYKKKFTESKLAKFHTDKWKKKKLFQYIESTKKININRWHKIYKDYRFDLKLKVLDIGCGDGSFLFFLKKKKFKQLFGFDICRTVIKKKQKRNITFFQDNFKNFYQNPIICNLKFNYLFLHDVLEHAYEPSELIRNIRKISKKSSKLFIKIPSADSLILEMMKEYSVDAAAPFHRTLFSKKGIAHLLKKEGFKNVIFLKSDIKNYGWTRGISEKFKLGKMYEQLRKNKKFVKLDYEIDDLFEKISTKVNKEPVIFLKCSQN
jgi:SAM-dependent methyltransferase